MPSDNPLLVTIDRDSFFPLPKETRAETVFFVLSRRGSFNVRQMIRRTWASGNDNVYFVIGASCDIPPLYRDLDEGGNVACKVSSKPIDEEKYASDTRKQIVLMRKEGEQVFQEQKSFEDMLLVNEIDVYRSLPKKLKFIYAFVSQKLRKAKWVVKIDDDFFVRVNQFEEFVSGFNDSVPTIISGLVAENAAATTGKWKEVPQYPRGRKYPPFPLGSYGHAVNRPVIDYLSRHIDDLIDYQGEDTSLGIWLSQSAAPSIRFEVTKKMKNNGVCLDSSVLIVGHDISPGKMLKCSKEASG